MTTVEPSPPDKSSFGEVPWWLTRSTGVGLLVLVLAVGWAVSWSAAGEVVIRPPVPAERWPTAAVTFDPPAAPKRPGGSRPPVDDQKHDTAVAVPALAGTDASPLPARRERRQVRERRAHRADRDLAAFIESVGLLEVFDGWVPPLPPGYRITATFGQGGSLWSNDHTGVDLAAPSGTPVSAVAAGTITTAGSAGAYGLRVEVTHADGTVTSYSHLSRLDVSAGQVVEQGAVVGAVGSTGNSTGPHLHLELKPPGGGPIDPVAALLARGVGLG